jgi:hypothetical protein
VTHTFGSAPGSTHRSCTIPYGWTFLGLFGGTGGHLHNLGIVIMKDAEKKKEEIDGGEGRESLKSDCTDAVAALSNSQAVLGIARSSAHLISSQPTTSHHIPSHHITSHLISSHLFLFTQLFLHSIWGNLPFCVF